jgi:hypothetical protein
MFGERAPSTENSAKISSVMLKAFLRPMRSATVPQATAPTAMPMRFAVATRPFWPAVRPNSVPTSGVRNPLRATSQASNM